MRFDWDDDKNQRNIAKHGVSFENACKIFDGPTLDVIDDRFDYGEERVISIGMLADIAVLAVVHTDRHGVCRIISARPAKRSERKRYDQAIRQSFKS